MTERSPAGFRVRGSEGAEGTFSWRVVAKRKDIAAPRFEPVEISTEPTLPPVPDSVYQEMPTPPGPLERMVGPVAAAKAEGVVSVPISEWPGLLQAILRVFDWSG